MRVLFLLIFLSVIQSIAYSQTTAVKTEHDGSRDFDWGIGTWKTDLKRRLRPLTGSDTWAEYTGTSVVRPVWGGKGNLVELDVKGATGRIEGISLRLYNPESRQWSLNFANSSSGTLFVPTIGAFRNGRGEFYNQEMLDGRPVFVRFVMWCSKLDLCHFEQSFSEDGGRNWEVNWIATDTRLKK